jgi:hypothetical protein
MRGDDRNADTVPGVIEQSDDVILVDGLSLVLVVAQQLV